MITGAFLMLIFFQEIRIRISATDTGTNSSSLQEGQYATRTYRSHFDSLVDGASNNSIINISATTVLSSIVVLEYLENITVIGDSIDCNNTGSVKFISCKNVTFEGISWERCGNSTNPAIGFTHSSDVVIQSCSFHHSTGQSVVLSNMSGNVYINNCQFIHNNEYEGHGTAIYISQSENHVQSNMVVDMCNFTLNGHAESVVYIDGTPTSYNDLTIQNSVFVQNEGVPIYISHTNLHLSDTVLFEQNKAIAGGGIYGIHSNIIFHDTSDVMFYNNYVETDGGCIYLDESNVSFISNSTENFTRNNAQSNGGVIYSTNESIVYFSDKSMVVFSDNKASSGGGAVFCEIGSFVTFEGSASIKFVSNSASIGGAVYISQNCVISFNGMSCVTFASNRAYKTGGAIFGFDNSSILFDGENTSVVFVDNVAFRGGAIHGSYITFGGSGNVNFAKNCGFDSGTISVESGHIRFDGSTSVTFVNNAVGGLLPIPVCGPIPVGGPIAGTITLRSSHLTFTGTTSVIFNDNTASYGGAIYGIT